MNLVDDVYALTRTLPRYELYGLAGQMQRAAVSVPSNLAEGHTREHSKEYLNHISIANSSLAELETQLEIAARQGYISSEHVRDMLARITDIKRQLCSLRNAVQRRSQRR